MAEEKKKLEINDENIEAIITNGETVTTEMAIAAAKIVADRRKEKLTEEYVSIITKSEWLEKRIAVSMRHSKEFAKIQVNYTKAFTELRKKLTEGDKTIGISEFTKLTKEARELAKKKMRENDTKRDEQIEALNNQYPEARWNWRYDDLLV